MRAEGAAYLSERIGPLIFNPSLSDCCFPLGPTLHGGSHLQPKVALGETLNYESLADVVGKIMAPIDVCVQRMEFGYMLGFMT